MTLEVKESVFKRASERDDEWGKTVESQLLSSNDLVAEEAIYHNACMGKFRLSKPSAYEKPGRPVNTEMFYGFEAICTWLEEEGDCDFYTMNKLQEKIKLMDYECYSNKRLKQKLKEKYIHFQRVVEGLIFCAFKNSQTMCYGRKRKEK